MPLPTPLAQVFYDDSTLAVARALLGKVLIREHEGALWSGVISETEAYCGPHDLACHASKGRTKRTGVMFGQAGHWYVYLIYGMYHCLNVVTESEGYPAAVLIRAVRAVSGLPPALKTDGPGKLCRAFRIDRTFNGAPAFDPAFRLWIGDNGYKPRAGAIRQTPRIGVDYAQEYKDKPWRFLLE